MKIKNQVVTLLFTLLVLFPMSCAVTNAPADHQSEVAGASNAPPMPPDTSSAELNRIKALAGKWKSMTSMFGKENEEVFTEYKISAGGSAVVETIFPGTPQEMVSVYYDDDHGKLAMTHYCMMRNRPQFSLAKSGNDEIKLDVTKVEGLTSKDSPSMGAITLKFDGKDKFSSTCESSGKEDPKHEPMTMHYIRVE